MHGVLLRSVKIRRTSNATARDNGDLEYAHGMNRFFGSCASESFISVFAITLTSQEAEEL